MIDTVNNIVFADFRISNEKISSIDSIYPNRAYVQFDKLSSDQRDSIVAKTWISFRDSFLASIDSKDFDFERRKSNLYLNLCFNNKGELTHVLFNWLDGIEFSAMTKHFIRFTSKYDFSSFPAGKHWSQCGTITLNRKKLKKRS